MRNKKCIVMFSGGLDSRLAVKIMQEQDFKVVAVFFKLPFGGGCGSIENEVKEFCKKNKVELKIFNVEKGKLLKDFLQVVKKPKHKRGTSLNPCVDCRIFILKNIKKFAREKNIELIVTGEILGERPMSQNSRAMKIVKEESGLKEKLLRPLSAKLLKKTKAEKENLVDRKKLFEICGRRREKQIELAKKFKISYPSPGGGCLLCEKELKKRFEILLENNLITEKTLPLIKIGRHFFYKSCWFVVARQESEGIEIEKFKNNFIEGVRGKPSVYFEKSCEKNFAKKLQEIYSKGISEKQKKKFEKYKL